MSAPPSKYSLATQVRPGFGALADEATENKLGDTYYAADDETIGKLAGNIDATQKVLTQTGTGTVSAAPEWVTLSGLTGPTGPSGPTGATGPSGVPSAVSGPTGPSGTPGGAGATGPSGAAGSAGATGSAGPSGTPSTVAGPTGPSGAAGGTGATGPSGTPSSVAGPTGATGPSGPSGTPDANTLSGTTLKSTVVNSSLTSVGTLAGLTVTAAPTFSALTAGSVPFAGTAGILSQDNANLFWDNATKRLGLGTTAPDVALHVAGNAIRVVNSGTNSYIQQLPATGAHYWDSLGIGLPTVFRVSNASAVDVTALTILSTGNVGIGTTDPKAKLHVVGLDTYASNAAAVTAGLTAGAFYRSGDVVCVVH